MFDTTKFGTFVARLRKSADMTQSELADRLGLTRQAVSRYECGDSFPDISVLREIASTFGVSLELLVNSADPTDGEAEIINGLAAGRDVQPKDASDVVNLAPWLRPSVLQRLSESLSKQGLDMSHVLSLAEYMNDSDTQKLMKAATFDSLAEMDVNLLEHLLPMLGPYAAETIFQKIMDGELNYHYLELLDSYSNSQIESAVIYGALEAEALYIMRRNNYNRYRMAKRGVIKHLTCPSCGQPLLHYYPRRCKCGCLPPLSGYTVTLCEASAPLTLDITPLNPDFMLRKFGEKLIILLLGCADIDAVMNLVYGCNYQDIEVVVLDSDANRLHTAEESIRSRNYGQILFAQDDIARPHLMDGVFDLIVDNTADRLGCTNVYMRTLKPGGCVIRGSEILEER
ncbi:MAG: DNA (cytosine-5-)-methyltransferase [Clostridia bacterium]|nr:DNA (cytosine-5-)-methyltransferase [Clostridia bacterium]